MAGGGVRDECVNDPNGVRDGGSASDTGMDDLKMLSLGRLRFAVYQTYSSGRETRGRFKRPHRRPSQLLAVACEMSVLTIQTGAGMVAVLLVLPWTI